MIRILAKQRTGLNIVHINAQSLRSKIDEFRHIFVLAGIDIICVSETWFPLDVRDSVFDLHGFRLFRSDRKILVNNIETRAKGGGVAIYVRNGIPCKMKLLNQIGSEIEYLFLDISTPNGEKFLLGCVYRPNCNMSFSPFISILEEISTTYNDIVIIGDFNNNLLVDNPLADLMLSLHLEPVNVSTPTHFHSTSNSLIDLVFVNHKTKVLFYDQISASCFSNHDLLFLTYYLPMCDSDKYIRYRDFLNTDCNTLSSSIDNIYWDRIYTLPSVNDQLSFIHENVRLLFDMCVPVKTKLIRGNQQPWFNAEIKRLIQERNNAFSRWKRFRTDELRFIYKSARREVTRRIKLEKTLFYGRKFSIAIDNKSKWKEIRRIGIGRKYQGTHNLDIDANTLNHQFVNVNVPTPTGNTYDDLCCVPLEDSFSFRCINELEVLECFSSVKSNAIGPDDLDPRFVRALIPKLLPYFTHLFNTILTKSTFPDDWKQSKIVPIPKSNNEYRPIAILPFLSKVMESIIARQMTQYLESNNFLSDRQSGFRKARSCTTALINVVEDIRVKLDDNCIAPLVLLDHTKAFDTVDHGILVKKLQKFFYFSGTACNLICSYLAHRYQRVHADGTISDPLNISRGVPQGSVLGPLLFCIYINDLPDVLAHCDVHMYADDVQLYMSTKITNIGSCIDCINDDLRKIDNWAMANGLCINPSKSKCLILSKFRSPIDHASYPKLLLGTRE